MDWCHFGDHFCSFEWLKDEQQQEISGSLDHMPEQGTLLSLESTFLK